MNKRTNVTRASAAIPLMWWEGSGFLYGDRASVNVDDPTRISTRVYNINRSSDAWQPLATGVFNIPSSVDGAPATAPRPHAVDERNPEWVVASPTPLAWVDPPAVCKLNCTMGGCSDPTSDVHDACMDAGCCNAFPPPSAPADAPTTTTNISQMTYGDTDCTVGPGGKGGFCRSEYTYKQCKPGSNWRVWEDPQCATTSFKQPVPYYVVR